jgi:lysophospholipase L1-like esterase
LILGDSNLARAPHGSFRTPPATHILSLSGLRLEELPEVFYSLPPSNKLETIILHLGYNDSYKGIRDFSPARTTRDTILHKYPKAHIYIILPKPHPTLCRQIATVTAFLRQISNYTLTLHTGPEHFGGPNGTDYIHLNHTGAVLLSGYLESLLQLIPFLPRALT